MIPSKHPHLFVAAATHAGMKGKNNEDRYAVFANRVSQANPTPSLVALVCDGIGGHRAGEVAAQMAIEGIARVISASDARNPVSILERALTSASEAIRNQAEKDPAQQGMGATCVCAWVLGDRLYVVSAGDSRLYLLRGNVIRQATTDHTWIQEAIDYGALTPEQAHGHPNAHVIRRYLGSQTPVVPDFRLRLNPIETDAQAEANQGIRLLPGDQLILCSDGLTDLVNQDEILEAFTKLKQEDAIQHLINLANERGGHDNITVAALQMPGEVLTRPRHPVAPPEKKRASRCRRWLFSCLLVFSILAVLILLGVVAWWYVNFGGNLDTKPAPTQTPFATWTMAPALATSDPTLLTATPRPPSATTRITNTPRPTRTPTRTPSLLEGKKDPES